MTAAEITQGIAAASNYCFSFGLQPRDKNPYNSEKTVIEYIEALEFSTNFGYNR